MVAHNLILDNHAASGMALGAVLVISGVVLFNSIKSITSDSQTQMILGALAVPMFVLGWVMVGYTMASAKPTYAGQSIAGAAGVVVAVLLMKFIGEFPASARGLIESFALALFVGSWILIGYTAGCIGYMGMLPSMIAVACVFASMLLSLPIQRMRCMVDGPGMPLFVIGWALLTVGVARKASIK